ncbi:Bifunctional glutamate/proline--tRNA ligase [Araneus ventricosus]|uniref:Bifunctional glutamate/proline--tRNA ligase n=1 Tax=Araneus ventricosus TaxID=182803 RepID=A0A4Y2DGR8_ARAVE|nr:Bifunctional glutamate/proline--tRNA ligase [Araneus ventricosus]
MHSLQNVKINCSRSVSSAPILILAELTKDTGSIKIEWGNTTALEIISKQGSAISFTSVYSICRFLARTTAPALYGNNILEKTEVDHWLEFCSRKYTVPEFKESLKKLDSTLSMVTFLVGDALTLADICVWSLLYKGIPAGCTLPQNVKRWFTFLSSQPAFQAASQMFPQENPTSDRNESSNKVKMEDKGKFVELPGAEMGKVVVRFPPEASGYLHIGHAKAALLNAHYQTSFQGKLVMRFDDTNPEKEKEDFEKVILEDVAMLQVKPDIFSYTSDHFDFIEKKLEELLKSGLAYVDDTDPETMKNEREQRVESRNRNNDVEKNWKMWQEMKKGTDYGKTCCVRAKIDMSSDNGCLRDPTLYRCKDMPHPRTGNKYKVYPTYDFACPIVDSIEGVTHALRTTEYHDRDAQFEWVLDAVKLRKPYVWEYSRLNMTHTVLSKRKLTWFVNEGFVDDWEDPRMPTVRGVLRRGMTVEGLKQFIVAQGSSRSVVVMEWDKIWAFNKKIIDPIAPRYNAVERDNCVPVIVEGATNQTLEVAKHPKNPDLGTKTIHVGSRLLVDDFDAKAMKVGENVTFINWGNLLITNISKKADGEIECVNAKLNLDDKDYKKTLKVTWVVDSADSPLTPCMCVYYDHLVTKPVLGKDDDFKKFLNKNTKIVVNMKGDADLTTLKKGDIIQIQRKGFFICDEPYDPSTMRYTSCAGSVVLFYIPDGSKDTSALPCAVRKAFTHEESLKEKITSLKGKDFERSPQEESKGICSPAGDVSMSYTETDSGSQNLFETAMNLDNKIKDQGNLIRKLKSEKAEKSVIDTNVKLLLQLKGEFKQCTGKDWVPGIKIDEIVQKQSAAVSVKKEGNPHNNPSDAASIHNSIKAQGDLVRKLKSEKADKKLIDENVQQLLKLKGEFKKVTGLDWKPDIKLPTAENKTSETKSSGDQSDSFLDQQIRAQGDIVRKLKSEKAEKSAVDTEVQKLLKLKAEFKNATGFDWKPDFKPQSVKTEPRNPKDTSSNDASVELDLQIGDLGNLIRKLKADKAEKSVIDENVKKLLKLKEDYKNASGKDWKPNSQASETVNNPSKKSSDNPKKQAGKNKPVQKTEKAASENPESGVKKITRLGLEVKKEEDLAEWYSQVLTKGEMIEYYDVSGCYILRPWAYSIWEAIQKFFDAKIKELGVTNCYFPMFVSSNALEKEKTHIADFAPEVAWVTKSGSSELEKPIAIRPTSETVMYPSYAKWIRSHRDLPLRLNQWCSVVRWEFRNPQPFIRTREFLWQEGHTAFAVKEEAENEVYSILEFYSQVYENLLAIPVIRGRKTEKEKFAGADFTTTTELYVPASGRGLQGATSHHLGQNFSKMFEIVYEDPETNEKQYVYQNSWGLSTRTIGAMVMVHADNTGLVLPPRVAAHQVVIVPCGITASMKESEKDALLVKCSEFESILKKAGVAVKGDYRDNYSPGWKFNDWELKGVPIRVELGPKDMKKNQFVAVRRDTGEKITMGIDTAPNSVLELLDNIHANLYNKAKKAMEEHLAVSYDWSDFCTKLNKKFILMSPFCGEIECEEQIKKESAKLSEEVLEPGAPAMGAKSLCMPFQQPAQILPDTKCINPSCKRKPKNFTLFGRSY